MFAICAENHLRKKVGASKQGRKESRPSSLAIAPIAGERRYHSPCANMRVSWERHLHLSWVGATFWHHCVPEHSKIPKMPVINPLQALVHPQTQKKKNPILHGLSILNPNFSEYASFSIKICRLGIWFLIFQAIDELVSSKNPNLLF